MCPTIEIKGPEIIKDRFNFLKNSTDTWWDHTSIDNKDNIPLSNYEQPAGSGQLFYYNDFLTSGSTIKGDFCETSVVNAFSKDVRGVEQIPLIDATQPSAFLTLTIPKEAGYISPRVAYKRLLEPFIRWLRRRAKIGRAHV